MSEKNKWHSKWWITSIVLPVFATLVADKIEAVPLLTTLFKFFDWCKTAFFNLLNFEIKVWYILVFISTSIFTLYLLSLIQKNKKSKMVNQKPFINYTKDRLKKWLWEWDYELNSSTGKYEIVRLQPVCISCDIQMLVTSAGWDTYYRCPKCGKRTADSDWESTDDIQALIYDNVRKGNFNA